MSYALHKQINKQTNKQTTVRTLALPVSDKIIPRQQPQLVKMAETQAKSLPYAGWYGCYGRVHQMTHLNMMQDDQAVPDVEQVHCMLAQIPMCASLPMLYYLCQQVGYLKREQSH